MCGKNYYMLKASNNMEVNNMSLASFFKGIGKAIVKGAKAIFSFITGTSVAAKIVRVTVGVAIPVALAAVEIVKTIKRVKDNKSPSNIMEQALINDDDNDMNDSCAKSSYRNTVKRIAKNIGNTKEIRPITKKKDLLRELKRTCNEIDRENDSPFGYVSEKEIRAAREEMNRISRRVRNRRCLV